MIAETRTSPCTPARRPDDARCASATIHGGTFFDKVSALRTELVDLAYRLECEGRVDAADVAITLSARMGEWCDEFALATE